MPDRSVRGFGLSCAAALVLALAGCAPNVRETENTLARVGFTMVQADTAQRKAALASLQPHKFSMQTRNDKVMWVYADPTICHCLYVGDQFAYDNYLAAMRAKADQQYERIVAASNMNNAMSYPFRWTDWHEQ